MANGLLQQLYLFLLIIVIILPLMYCSKTFKWSLFLSPVTQWSEYFYYPQLMDKETVGTAEVSNSPKVTQMYNGARS